MEELNLVNRVDLKIALANNDAQLESSLNLYLSPVLLKLSSPHSNVRQAVFKIIQNVITRLGAARTIKLPADALIQQVKDPKVPNGSDPSSVRLYSLLFISKAVERMDDLEKKQFIPKVLNGISTFPSSVSARLFNIFCKLITNWKAPDSDSPEYEDFNKDLDTEDEIFLCNKVSKFLLMSPSDSPVPVVRPGLSVEDVSFFTKEAGVNYTSSQQISLVKQSLLEYLKVGFMNETLAIPLLLASADSASSISNNSEMLYKKLNMDLEDPSYIDALIKLFIGDTETPPVSSIIQEKILGQLNKSVVACQNPNISQITDIGLSSDTPRLKQATVQFVKWININSTDSQANEVIMKFNTNMATKLKDSIISDGWPNITGNNKYGNNNQASQQYEALANVLQATPSLFINDFSYMDFLFEALEHEDLKTGIQDGLSKLTPFLPQLSSECKDQLKIIAYKYLNMDESVPNLPNIHACRFISLKFINCAFPFEDSNARYLNIIGTSKVNRPEAIEEATKGLHPHWFNINQSSNTVEFKATPDLLGHGNTVEFPDFYQLVNVINDKFRNGQPNDKLFDCLYVGIKFCIQTLVMHSIKGKKTIIIPDEEWDIRLDKALEIDPKVRDLVMTNIHKNQESFKALMLVIFESFQTFQTHNFESIFLLLLSLSPSDIVGGLAHLVSDILNIFNTNRLIDPRVPDVAKIVGILASHPINSNQVIADLLTSLVNPDLPPHKGKSSLLMAGYLYSRLGFRQRIDVIDQQLFTTYLEIVLRYLKDTNTYNSALIVIGELTIYGLLGPQLTIVSDTFIKDVIEVIKPKVKKYDEQSVLVLSYISLCCPSSSEEIESIIYETHTCKQTEYLFTSGEAFSIISCGWKSKVLARVIDIQDGEIKYIPENIERSNSILNMILTSCSNTKPSLRRAGCIWLLSIVDFCNELPMIKDNAGKIHLTFMKFLADRDELVQEAASRGLSLIYELGDVELKDSLVKGLLKSFTDTNSTNGLISGTVEEDTELFDKDVLRTNDGSVSTYRDVLNLAADVGDPSLVYKFMSLAKSSALWSSRKGMAFGLGAILSKTSLDDMLVNNKGLSQRLIPKLYRYRYDPSTSVSNSMNEIWNVLIDDSSKTIKENFDNILQELLKGMGNKEWRVRQASTTAMIDLLNVVEFKVYEFHLEQIWNMSFRVMDDIKESVRKEANKLTKQLANILTRSSKVSTSGSSGLDKLIPFLLGNKGLLSDAEDIRNFALDTILKLIKTDSKAIKKFIPLLLETFIGLMSTLEPEIVNYLVLNADKYNITGNEIDAKRLQSLGNSPMMDAIDKMIDILDYDIINDSITCIINSIKKSIGLPSKVCGSRVLVSLVNKKYELIKPYGDKLFKIAMNQIKDKNDTISASYSISVAYLSRLSSLELILKYGEYLKKLYFESDDERNRLVSAICNENFAKYSSEKFEKVSSLFLPICFIGTNDIDKDIAKIFEKQWIENTSGSNVIKLYLPEIIDIMDQHISSPNFQIRQILAKTIVKITHVNDFTSISESVVSRIFEILITSCKGKSWSGKELIFEALVNFTIKNKQRVPSLYTINDIVLVEAKRKNKEYQKHAIKIMGKYLYEFPDDGMIHVYVDIMNEIVNGDYESDDEDAMDVDSSRTKRVHNSHLEEKTLTYITNLFDTFNASNLNHELFDVMISSALKLLNDENELEITWRSKISINDCFAKLITELGDVEFEVDELLKVWDKLNQVCSNFNNIENVKVKFIRNSKLFITYLENFHYSDKVEVINNCLNNFNEDSSIIRAELKK